MGQKTVSPPELSWDELNKILARRLPEEELLQVRTTVQKMVQEGGDAAFWKAWDIMTGMYNQTGLLRILEQWKKECIESGERLLILCVDVERLSNINTIYGRSEGDSAIRVLAHVLEDALEEDEICGRIGSGEFVVAMRTTDEDTKRAYLLFRKLEKSLEHYNRISGKEYSLHATYSLWNGTLRKNSRMQSILDRACAQKQKHSDINKHSIGGMGWHVNAKERRQVEDVINHNRFRYAYQPIVDAKSGDIYAYEALMRTEEGIDLSPLTILRYAELDNRYYDIERATFFNVMEQAKELPLGNRKIFINSIPGHQLDEEDYRELREQYSCQFANMVVEITEQTELTEDRMRVLLNRSEGEGFGIAIDDYGTGYSNMANLLRFLPNCIKIDRLLITDIQENPKKQHFVDNIITFAHENGILALAEGVEKEAELKAVIQMGIDLVQGYYTARPNFELLTELDEQIKNEIVSANIHQHNFMQRKVYIVSDERELSLMRLALEQYTGIVVSQPEITLVGNVNYLAGMSIKIKDECSCRVVLRDAWLEGIEDFPCIDIGADAELTLVLEGTNILEKAGIRVPDGSRCRIEGKGDLEIRAGGIRGFGIGNDFNSGVGEIVCATSGRLAVNSDGNQAVCIGGGIYRQGEGIQILGGKVELCATGVEAVGIGCVEGSVPIEIRECGLDIDFRAATGNAIGSSNADQNILISHARLGITGSGSRICGMGSIEKTGGKVRISMAEVMIRLTGQTVWLMGNEGGAPAFDVDYSSVKLIGEGNCLLGIGAYDRSASVDLRFVTLEVDIKAADPTGVGASDEAFTYEGGTRRIWLNEDH